MSSFCFSLTLLRLCDNIISFGWSCSEPAPSKFSLSKILTRLNTKKQYKLGLIYFNQSIKSKFSLYWAIWVCFTWIARCTPHPPAHYHLFSPPHPLSYTPRKESEELPVIGSLCLRKDFWDRHEANSATCWKDVCERLFWRPKKQFWREIITFYQ